MDWDGATEHCKRPINHTSFLPGVVYGSLTKEVIQSLRDKPLATDAPVLPLGLNRILVPGEDCRNPRRFRLSLSLIGSVIYLQLVLCLKANDGQARRLA